MASFLRRLFGDKQRTSSERRSQKPADAGMKEYMLPQLSASPVFTNSPTSSDDDQLVKHARSLMRIGGSEEAASIAQDGLQTCMRKDRLCEVMGDICLDKKNPAAIGWYMQACLIASPSWEPYLLVSYAARALGLDDMAWRCLNACDVIRAGPRIPELETAIADLVRNSDRSQLLIAMQDFKRAMDSYLPSVDELPHGQMEREIFLRQNTNGDPDMPPDKQFLRLMRRGR
jgi:hypothetical protein